MIHRTFLALRDRICRFLENDLAVAAACLVIALAGMIASYIPYYNIVTGGVKL